MADHSLETHHGAPRCLLLLYDQAGSDGLGNEGVEAWAPAHHPVPFGARFLRGYAGERKGIFAEGPDDRLSRR